MCTQVATVFSCARKTTANSTETLAVHDGEDGKQIVDLTQSAELPGGFQWRATSLRYCVERVKRTLHIGIFLQRQHVSDVSLAGIFPICGDSPIPLQIMFFLRSIDQLIQRGFVRRQPNEDTLLASLTASH